MLEPVPPCRCKRSRASRMFYRTRGGGELCAIKQCERCLGYLPMGPSEDVTVEVRAAELSDLALSHATTSESHGWNLCRRGVELPTGIEDDAEYISGYLAYCIYDHPGDDHEEAP